MKRWWGIRHARWLYHSHRFLRWWRSVGQHLGAAPNPADIRYLNAVWRGEE